MTKTKTQQAREYAEKKNKALRKAWYEYRYGEICDGDDWENDPVKPSYNFKKGFLAGISFCEQSMWRSVEELPEEGAMVIAHSPNSRYEVLKFHDGIFIDELGQQHCVDFFIILPSLPDTNTEKK